MEAPPTRSSMGPCNGDLSDPAGARALSVDDDPGLVVDEIIGVISEKGSVFFLATHAACGSVSDTSLGGLRLLPPLNLSSSSLLSAWFLARV